ncbi:hypothetical protein LOK49_LG02G03818 [Camellia lanceoleosa]|uniref:Uncharacterized protein n=1 Tax=Camellia lanceoleosa TaxID=1840588 RepID=A0ACC0IT39_9ERIC|nr:hypothetical protein LOK49_LG02G03818 [Camellia lanceoleosa]
MKMKKKKSVEGQVMDGSDIMELVGNEEVFSSFVDHKFEDLDRDCDGKLSVKELQPAVDIGVALGLLAQGSSHDSDHIYSGVSPFSLSLVLVGFYLSVTNVVIN